MIPSILHVCLKWNIFLSLPLTDMALFQIFKKKLCIWEMSKYINLRESEQKYDLSGEPHVHLTCMYWSCPQLQLCLVFDTLSCALTLQSCPLWVIFGIPSKLNAQPWNWDTNAFTTLLAVRVSLLFNLAEWCDVSCKIREKKRSIRGTDDDDFS